MNTAKDKKIKSSTFILIAVCILVALVFSVKEIMRPKAPNLKELYEMSSGDCLEALEKYGLKIPDLYIDRVQAADAAKAVVDALYDYEVSTNGKRLDSPPPYSFTALSELSERIYNIVYRNYTQ